jgi:hypothetical protein
MSAAMTIKAYLKLRDRMHGDREEIIPAANATKLIPTRAPLKLALPLHESTLLPPESQKLRRVAQCSSS